METWQVRWMENHEQVISSHLELISFDELVLNVNSDSCSWLIRVKCAVTVVPLLPQGLQYSKNAFLITIVLKSGY